MTSFSVVIPHYGDPRPTLDLVRALEPQPDVRDAPEIIVVDDHSPEAFPPDTPGCAVIRRETNGGFGSAVNSGLYAASHEMVLVLNSDLDIEPHAIASFARDAAALMPAVVSPQVVGHEGEPQWVGRHFPTVLHQAVEWLTPLARFRHLRILHELVGHDTRCTTGVVRNVDWVIGACMALPRKEVLEAGGFDERFFMNCEEVDLQKRLGNRGVPAVFHGKHTVVHQGGGSSNTALRRRWLVASRNIYARKWGRLRRLRTALTACSLVNFLVNGARQALGRDVRAVRVLREEWGLIFQSGRGSNQQEPGPRRWRP